jgi:hypothetical protein
MLRRDFKWLDDLLHDTGRYGSLWLPEGARMGKKKAGGKVKTALFLEPHQVQELKHLQRSFAGISMSEHIRRAVALYILQMKEVEKKMPLLPGAPVEKK